MKIACYRRSSDAPTQIGVVDVGARTVQQIITPAAVELAGVVAAIGIEFALGPVDQLDTVDLLAPVPRPARNIFCVGKNYREHVAEVGTSGYDSDVSSEIPDRPIVFTKPPSAVVGPGSLVEPHRALTRQLDYEGELAVIIGQGGRGIGLSEAMDHVWGYTIVNDVTARDLQQAHRQWFLGKGLDTFCPMGPWAVTADEVDVADLAITTTINGELRQQASVTDLIFDVPTLIHAISAGITLEPGDIIATGTPAGVGMGFTPPRFLQPGDLMEVTISGIGTLTNQVGDVT